MAKLSHTESDLTGPAAGRTVDTLDRALRDASTPTRTRRWLLERAAVGAAGVAAASVVIPAGEARARSHSDSINEWGVFASTTEARTVTIVTELVRRTSKHPEVPSSVSVIFDGVYAAERDHWLFTSKHWRPSTTRFWIASASRVRLPALLRSWAGSRRPAFAPARGSPYRGANPICP